MTNAHFVEFPNRIDGKMHRFIQASNDITWSVKYYRISDRKEGITMSADCKPRYAIEKDPDSGHGILGYATVTGSPDAKKNDEAISRLKETFGYDYPGIEVKYEALLAFGNDIRVTISHPKRFDGTCELSIRQMDHLLTDVEKAFMKLEGAAKTVERGAQTTTALREDAAHKSTIVPFTPATAGLRKDDHHILDSLSG